MEEILVNNEGKTPVEVCNRLRTKSFYVLGRFHNEYGESSPTAQYWCLNTMLSFGPDGSFVSPEECRTGRCCYENCP